MALEVVRSADARMVPPHLGHVCPAPSCGECAECSKCFAKEVCRIEGLTYQLFAASLLHKFVNGHLVNQR
jgi:hypothetical protein